MRLVTSSTTTNNGIIPELRGSNILSGSTSGMLVVIDGFIQDDFPANYPMNNVESVEVIRDPNETVKWGPKASGGVILIKTNMAASKRLSINYSSNISYSSQPDNSNDVMQLASTADVLDYYKESYDKGLSNYLLSDNLTNLTTAQRVLHALYKGTLGEQEFQSKWDSLALLSNRDQLRMLQQSSFSQNHSLSLAGGTNAYRFNIMELTEALDLPQSLAMRMIWFLNMKNQLHLLKGKLRIKADVSLNTSKQNNGGSVSSDSMDPYQLLLDEQGNYVYNDYEVSPEQNATMQSLGYYNYGSNALEDLANGKNISKTFGFNSRLNMEWNLSKDIQWSTSLLYNPRNSTTTDLQNMHTSTARKNAILME